MSSKSFILLAFLIGSLWLTSCDASFFSKEIDSQSISDPLPAVQCELDGRSNQIAVTLTEAIPKYGTWTSGNFFNRFEPIKNAEVFLRQEDDWVEQIPLNQEMDSLIFTYKKTSNQSFPPGKEYTLEVNSPTYGRLRAQQSLPLAPELLDYKWLEGLRTDIDSEVDYKALEITLNNRNEEYFTLHFGAYDPNAGQSNFLLSNFREPIFKEAYFSFNQKFFAFEPKQSETTKIQIEFPVWLLQDLSQLGSIEVFLASCTSEHYDVHRSIRDQSQLNDGFFTEPVIVTSNFNKGLGHFTMLHSMEPFIIEVPEL
jgi:hypothetical protein